MECVEDGVKMTPLDDELLSDSKLEARKEAEKASPERAKKEEEEKMKILLSIQIF